MQRGGRTEKHVAKARSSSAASRARPVLAAPAARAPAHRATVTSRSSSDCLPNERVDDWRVNGETINPRFIHAAQGCYLLEVKYRQDYTRVHGASSLWGASPLAAAIDTAARTHTSHYETGYVPFALKLRGQRTYHVTATFDGDELRPRIVELNAAAERTREILPLRSMQELDLCRAHSPVAEDVHDVVCTEPVAKSGGLR